MEDSKITEKTFKKSKKTINRRYLELLLALTISAFLFNLLINPSNIACGGVAGVAVIMKHIYNWNPSIVIFIISIILLIFSYMYLGKERTKGTVIASISYPLLVEVTSYITQYITIDTNDKLLISLFIGIIGGLANGIIYKTGFSNGGFQIVSQILYKHFKIKLSLSTFIINAIIVIVGGYFFGITMVMYAIIILFIQSIIIDRVILGVSKNKAIYIVTSKGDKVKDFIIDQMKHSITIFNVKGAFLQKKREVLLTVIPTREYFVVTESIKLLDPEVFFVVNDAYEVKGGK